MRSALATLVPPNFCTIRPTEAPLVNGGIIVAATPLARRAELTPLRYRTMFGSHLSIAGGLHNALLSAEKFGMQTVQIFTKNQQQWKCKPLEKEIIEQWCTNCTRLKFSKTISHDSYLINLASPDSVLWQKSVELFIEEVSRCDLLGI